MSETLKSKHLLIYVNEDQFFISHRLHIGIEALKKFRKVSLLLHVNGNFEFLKSKGFNVIPISLSRQNKNFFKEIRLLIKTINILKREKPDILHNVTVKPILWGSIAAKVVGIPYVINAFAGLGTLFIRTEFKWKFISYIVQIIFRFIFRLNHKSIALFQNSDDQKLMEDLKIVRPKQSVIIKGSGVNTTLFKPANGSSGIPRIICVSRMLKDKGIYDFIEAAKIINSNSIQARFTLVGQPDDSNPSSISSAILDRWNSEGIIEWLGYQKDVHTLYDGVQIAVLPSYREGLPKSLLEAAACGKAIIATDVPGCREICRAGYNGLLVPVQSPLLLAEAIETLIKNRDLRLKMGENSRQLVEKEFSEEIIRRQTFKLYENLFHNLF